MKATRKKFVTQMTDLEVLALHAKLEDVNMRDWKLSQHCMDRILEKNIYAFRKDLIAVISHCNVYEYKVSSDGRMTTERIVVRDVKISNGQNRLNIVFDVTTKTIVTVWLNNVNDLHATLDMSVYDATLMVA